MQLKTNRKFNYHAIMGENNPLSRFPDLYESALDEFSQKSYEQASLNEVLARANMAKSSLYHHFGDKFGLYLAMMDKIAQKKIAFFYPLMQQKMPDGDFFGSMREISKAVALFMFEDKRMYAMSNIVMDADSQLFEKLFEYLPYGFDSGIEPLIRSAYIKGQIDPRYSPEFLTKLLSIVLTNMNKVVQGQSAEQAMESLRLVFDVLENGCAAKRH